MKKTNLGVYLIAETNFKNPEEFPEFNTPFERFNFFGGLAGGICYMPADWNTLKGKPAEVTIKRANGTKAGGHHSVFEHSYVSMYLENIPKLFAMIINNEKTYVTSEKSARYTKMEMEGEMLEIYNKWLAIFVDLIKNKYGNETYFDDKRITKLAQENARYFLSVYTPTNMMYSVSYRQLNYMYNWLKNAKFAENDLILKLKPYFEDFCEFLEEFGLIDEALANDQKNRGFSLFANRERKEYFGDTYCVNYLGSFAELAQAQRHRSLNYEMIYEDDDRFYVPKLIRDDEFLVQEWNNDMKKVKAEIPQGKLIKICERGTPELLILKAKERCCTCAQLEINDQTSETLNRYKNECEDEFWKTEMEKYTRGARCTFPEYKCPMPCMFADGVKMDRLI